MNEDLSATTFPAFISLLSLSSSSEKITVEWIGQRQKKLKKEREYIRDGSFNLYLFAHGGMIHVLSGKTDLQEPSAFLPLENTRTSEILLCFLITDYLILPASFFSTIK